MVEVEDDPRRDALHLALGHLADRHRAIGEELLGVADQPTILAWLDDLCALTEGDDATHDDPPIIPFGVTQHHAHVEGTTQLPHRTPPSCPCARLNTSISPSKNSSTSTRLGFHRPRGLALIWRSISSANSSEGGAKSS